MEPLTLRGSPMISRTCCLSCWMLTRERSDACLAQLKSKHERIRSDCRRIDGFNMEPPRNQTFALQDRRTSVARPFLPELYRLDVQTLLWAPIRRLSDLV